MKNPSTQLRSFKRIDFTKYFHWIYQFLRKISWNQYILIISLFPSSTMINPMTRLSLIDWKCTFSISLYLAKHMIVTKCELQFFAWINGSIFSLTHFCVKICFHIKYSVCLSKSKLLSAPEKNALPKIYHKLRYA